MMVVVPSFTEAVGPGVAAEWGTHFGTGREFTPVLLGSQWSPWSTGGFRQF